MPKGIFFCERDSWHCVISKAIEVTKRCMDELSEKFTTPRNTTHRQYEALRA